MSVKPSTAKIIRAEAERAVRDMPFRRWYAESDREDRVFHVAFTAARLTVYRLPNSELPGVRSPSVVWRPSDAVKEEARRVAEELVPQDSPAVL